MTHIIIDRRFNDKGKSSVNRKLYIRRVRENVKEAVKESVREGSIRNIADSSEKRVNIPNKKLSQPTFTFNPGSGKRDLILPGNYMYQEGDRIDRPESSDGQGKGGGSTDGEGEDEFGFSLSQEEFLDLFFEDLELPDMIKKNLAQTDEYESHRAGYTVDGPPSRLNISTSMKQAKGRRIALYASKKKKLKEYQDQLEQLQQKDPITADDQHQIDWLQEQIESLQKKIKKVPFIDDVDLRYNHWEKQPVPCTQAVMFCLMDVSASMGQWEKEMAKRFFSLLYLFLTREYERVELVFIRHTQTAKEVDEDEFFYSKETGGTVVSSSLDLMKDIIDQRYPTSQWNIFGCQASDGDDWPDDIPVAYERLQDRILPLVQYYAYVEISEYPNHVSDLWKPLQKLAQTQKHFAISNVTSAADIYPVFRKLFEKGTTNNSN